jgi:hypothetical protein
VTDRERLFIRGSYYQRYLHDDRSARAAYEALTSLYPDDYWGINNLAATYQSLGMIPEEMKTREHLVALRPNDGPTRAH